MSNICEDCNGHITDSCRCLEIIQRAEIDSLKAQVSRLREALVKIEALKTMQLLGDAADFDFDAEECYAAGSHNAFCEAAGIAAEALKESGWEA